MRPWRAAWPLVLATLTVGCHASPPPSWGRPIVEPTVFAPRHPLVVRVSHPAGDLEAAARDAVRDAGLGTSSIPFTLSIDPAPCAPPSDALRCVGLGWSLSRGEQVLARDELTVALPSEAEARRAALARLIVRVEAQLARLDGATRLGRLAEGTPGVVIVERLAHTRDVVELSSVETETGHVLRHELALVADPASLPPGRAVLSRRTPEGARLDDAAYATLARRVAVFLDLRPIGDAHHLGYFGVKAAATAPRTSTPTRR